MENLINEIENLLAERKNEYYEFGTQMLQGEITGIRTVLSIVKKYGK